MAAPENREPPYPKIMYGVKGHLSRKEARLLRDTPGRLGDGNYFELGTFCGKSALCIADGIHISGIKGHLTTIDAYDLDLGLELNPRKAKYCLSTRWDIAETHFKERGMSKYITMVKDYTQLAAVRFKDTEVLFMFIDGDHEYTGVKADFEAWAPLIKSGGEIAFHDTHLDGPGRVVAESGWPITTIVDTIKVITKP